MKYFLAFIITLAVLTYPLSVIFAINSLFPMLSIPYGILQYMAVVILNVPLFSSLKTVLKVGIIAKFYELIQENLNKKEK